jgi:uncharacterized protein (DUF362 family)
MIDKDADYSYSTLVSVDALDAFSNKMFLSPNPATNKLIITHAKALKGASITISSTNGRIVMMQVIAMGSTQTSINTSGYAEASYFVSYQNGNSTTNKVFVK